MIWCFSLCRFSLNSRRKYGEQTESIRECADRSWGGKNSTKSAICQFPSSESSWASLSTWWLVPSPQARVTSVSCSNWTSSSTRMKNDWGKFSFDMTSFSSFFEGFSFKVHIYLMMIVPLQQKFFIGGHFYFSSAPGPDPNGQLSLELPFRWASGDLCTIKLDISSQPGPGGGWILDSLLWKEAANWQTIFYTSGIRPPRLQG